MDPPSRCARSVDEPFPTKAGFDDRLDVDTRTLLDWKPPMRPAITPASPLTMVASAPPRNPTKAARLWPERSIGTGADPGAGPGAPSPPPKTKLLVPVRRS